MVIQIANVISGYVGLCRVAESGGHRVRQRQAIYEAWTYDETTVSDQATSEGGLFAQYFNTFMKIRCRRLDTPLDALFRKRKQFISSAYVYTRGYL